MPRIFLTIVYLCCYFQGTIYLYPKDSLFNNTHLPFTGHFLQLVNFPKWITYDLNSICQVNIGFWKVNYVWQIWVLREYPLTGNGRRIQETTNLASGWSVWEPEPLWMNGEHGKLGLARGWEHRNQGFTETNERDNQSPGKCMEKMGTGTLVSGKEPRKMEPWQVDSLNIIWCTRYWTMRISK